MKMLQMLLIVVGATSLIGVARAADRPTGPIGTAAPVYLAANEFSISILDENEDLDSFTKRIDIEDEDGTAPRGREVHPQVHVHPRDEYEDSLDNHEEVRDDAVDHEDDVIDDSKQEVNDTHEGR